MGYSICYHELTRRIPYNSLSTYYPSPFLYDLIPVVSLVSLSRPTSVLILLGNIILLLFFFPFRRRLTFFNMLVFLWSITLPWRFDKRSVYNCAFMSDQALRAKTVVKDILKRIRATDPVARSFRNFQIVFAAGTLSLRPRFKKRMNVIRLLIWYSVWSSDKLQRR